MKYEENIRPKNPMYKVVMSSYQIVIQITFEKKKKVLLCSAIWLKFHSNLSVNKNNRTQEPPRASLSIDVKHSQYL
jgi:hypothetical protein